MCTALGAPAFALAGCASQADTSGSKAPTPMPNSEIEKQIAETQNNPNMPAQEKAMVISNLKSMENGSQGGRPPATAANPSAVH
ncbi:hypothetical protein CCAX7_57510 [Capsulimonas corticalis]|uniref:Uncharacterized protein n=1 Tax=Capsulimonas corticalis TaxID=2219043 RepID=A0A9N7QFY8_9BACT|nr:hypothetical protein CCAX7_57510 [Capsulimonas corticalis]